MWQMRVSKLAVRNMSRCVNEGKEHEANYRCLRACAENGRKNDENGLMTLLDSKGERLTYQLEQQRQASSQHHAEEQQESCPHCNRWTQPVH